MKPDKPGEWHSRDGRKIVVYFFKGDLKYREFEQSALVNVVPTVDALKGDDWLPAIAPKFPALPPKPALCFSQHAATGRVCWRLWDGKEFRGIDGREQLFAPPERLRVIPHPDNDPEAVAIIEAARK